MQKINVVSKEINLKDLNSAVSNNQFELASDYVFEYNSIMSGENGDCTGGSGYIDIAMIASVVIENILIGALSPFPGTPMAISFDKGRQRFVRQHEFIGLTLNFINDKFSLGESNLEELCHKKFSELSPELQNSLLTFSLKYELYENEKDAYRVAGALNLIASEYDEAMRQCDMC